MDTAWPPSRSRPYVGRVLLCVFGVLLFAWIGWFGWQVYRSYGLIRAGKYSELPGAGPSKAMVSREEISRRLSAPDAPSLGAKNPIVHIVEFIDYSCPYTRLSVGPIRAVLDQYPDVRLTVRDFPIATIHPRAPAAAIAAACAHAQNRFWAYHDRLFAKPDQHEDADLIRTAQEMGMDMAAFRSCFLNRTPETRIMRDLADGIALGVPGTPTLFINGSPITGALDAGMLEAIIKAALKK